MLTRVAFARQVVIPWDIQSVTLCGLNLECVEGNQVMKRSQLPRLAALVNTIGALVCAAFTTGCASHQKSSRIHGASRDRIQTCMDVVRKHGSADFASRVWFATMSEENDYVLVWLADHTDDDHMNVELIEFVFSRTDEVRVAGFKSYADITQPRWSAITSIFLLNPRPMYGRDFPASSEVAYAGVGERVHKTGCVGQPMFADWLAYLSKSNYMQDVPVQVTGSYDLPVELALPALICLAYPAQTHDE